MKRNFFKNSRDLDTFSHGPFENCCLPGVVYFPSEAFCLGGIAAQCLDELSNDLLERVDFVIEQNDPGGRLHEHFAI